MLARQARKGNKMIFALVTDSKFFMFAPRAKYEVKTPTLLTPGAVLIVSAYGLFLVIPAVFSMMIVSVLQYSWLTFLIPLVTIVVLTFFLPFGFGNPYVTRLVHSKYPELKHDKEGFVVQLTVNPRLHDRLRAVVEDADDIGWLSFTPSELVFRGDAVSLTVPLERIRNLKRLSGGWRWLFLYGPRTEFTIDGLPDIEYFRFAERSSWWLPTAKQIGDSMYARLESRIQRPGGQG